MTPKKPWVPKELLEWLEFQFPDRCPEPGVSIETIQIQVGQVSVVRHLKSLFKEQEKNNVLG